MFIAYPTLSSIQETSDESSIQYDSSSSEETFIRYVIKLTPNRKDIRDVIGVEVKYITKFMQLYYNEDRF